MQQLTAKDCLIGMLFDFGRLAFAGEIDLVKGLIVVLIPVIVMTESKKA